jgi:hypothetical protein
MAFNDLSAGMGTSFNIGQQAAGVGPGGNINQGLQTILQLLVQKKQQEQEFAQKQQLQQNEFGQQNQLQQMKGTQDLGLQAKAAQQKAWQDRVNAHTQQMQLQQRLAALQQIAQTRAGATTQAANARAQQQNRAGAVRMMTAGAPTPYQLAEVQSKVPWWDMLHMTPQSQAYQSLQGAAKTQGNIKQSLLTSAGEGTTQDPNSDDLYQRYMQEVSDNQLVQE